MSIATKLIAAVLVTLAVGVPALDTWQALALAASWIALVYSTCKPGWWRLAMAAGVVIAVVGVKTILPRANIAEAHNAFLVVREGEALQMGLPVEVFRSWKAHIDAFYPPNPVAGLKEIRGRGEKVYGIGAPSRASTLVNYVGLDDSIIDCVLEIEGSYKIGKMMPGTLIPVLEESKLVTDQPEYALLFSWHIADELIPKLKAKGFRGKFIVPLPSPAIL